MEREERDEALFTEGLVKSLLVKLRARGLLTDEGLDWVIKMAVKHEEGSPLRPNPSHP